MKSRESSEADSEDKLAWKNRLLPEELASVFLMTALVLSTAFGVIEYQIRTVAQCAPVWG